MSNTTAEDVIDSIDEALKDDHFETRQGLRFMATVLKQAMRVLGQVEESKGSTNQRLTNVENAINEFLVAQKKRRENDEAERSKWRWAIITPTLGLGLIELIKWIFR